MVKGIRVALIVVGGAGLLLSAVLTVREGIGYRLREEQGFDPVPAPDWVVVCTYAGLWVAALAALATVGLTISGVIALARHRRS